MTTYTIELNGQCIRQFQRKQAALNWVRRHEEEEDERKAYMDAMRIWERKDDESVCIWSNCDDDTDLYW